MEVVNVNISDIHPYSKNAKKHDRKQVKNVAESIRQYGFVQPIVLDRNNEIVIGHCRWEAAKLLKKEMGGAIPCVYVDGLSDAEVRALRLADNKLNESAWDISLLTEEIAGLDFGNIEIDWDLPGSPDKVIEDNYEPKPPEEPKAKLGDVYLLGRHRLMCGDSTQLSDVEKLMGGKKADMLLTDPPYNVALGTGGTYQTDEGRKGAHEAKDADGAFLLNDNLPDDEFLQFLSDAFSNAVMAMKPGAAFHIWHADTQRMAFDTACHNAGLIIRQCLIWVKDRFTLSRQDFQWQHEPCLYGERPFFEGDDPGDEHETALYGWKSGAGHYWFKNRKQSTVLFFDRPTVSKEHPTMKPITLFDYEMKCNSLVDDIVLDLFAGSGTTIMAAQQNGRVAYCMEYDPKYVDVIIDRWESWTGETAKLLNK